MDITREMLWGVGLLTLLCVVLLGPGLWSSVSGYPFIEGPLRWLRERLRRRRGRGGGASS